MSAVNPSVELPLIRGEGTAESAWQESAALANLAQHSIDGYRRAVVVAPHPDDETLALGGLIALMSARGTAVIVVTATDGEASHPFSSTLTPDELAVVRAEESRRALRVIGGARPGSVVNVQLHLGDGRVAEREAALTAALSKYLTPEDVCFATWEFDGHPDHEAVGRAASRAGEQTNARVLHYPVWMWHWATPNDGSIPWDRARRVELCDHVRQLKQAAIECYRTQIYPIGDEEGDAAIVAPNDLLHFQRPFEVVFE